MAGAGASTSSMVISRAGQIVGASGSSAGLGNELDLVLLKVLRGRANIVTTSAKTANAEQYRLPPRARLVVFGNATRLSSGRITHGENRLIVVGSANESPSISGTRHLASLALTADAIRDAITHGGSVEQALIHFEFGEVGLSTLEYQLSSFFCTAPNLSLADAFVARRLPGYGLVSSILLGDLSLSWWQRRGLD